MALNPWRELRRLHAKYIELDAELRRVTAMERDLWHENARLRRDLQRLENDAIPAEQVARALRSLRRG